MRLPFGIYFILGLILSGKIALNLFIFTSISNIQCSVLFVWFSACSWFCLPIQPMGSWLKKKTVPFRSFAKFLLVGSLTFKQETSFRLLLWRFRHSRAPVHFSSVRLICITWGFNSNCAFWFAVEHIVSFGWSCIEVKITSKLELNIAVRCQSGRVCSPIFFSTSKT